MDTFIITVTLLISIASFIAILFGVLHSTTAEERKDFIEKLNQRENPADDSITRFSLRPGTPVWYANEPSKWDKDK